MSIGSHCQESLFEEFFTHCTDLAPVLCVFRSPRKDETMKTAKSTGARVLSKDEFQAHATARFEKVMRKLNSATVSQLIDLTLYFTNIHVLLLIVLYCLCLVLKTR